MTKVKMYIPINRKTKQRYDAVTAEVRHQMETEAATKRKYDFEETEVAQDEPAERPAGVKPAAKPDQTAAKTEA